MRVRVDLTPLTYDKLVAKAIEERRPVDWQAEVLIESGLGMRHQRVPPPRAWARTVEGDAAATADQCEHRDARA
jgi:hypothetical protein